MRIYKRGKTWWCVYYDGAKRVRCSTKCTDKKAAEDRAREFERIAADPIHPSRYQATIADAVNLLIATRTEQSKAGVRSARTVDFYTQKSGHWTRVLRAEFKLSVLAPRDVDRFISQRRDEGASENTISKELVTMRAALKLARRADLWFGDPNAMIPAGFSSGYKPRERALSMPEIQRLLGELEPDRAARVAYIAATSARRGESDRARRDDVYAGEYVRLHGTKTERAARIVPVTTIEGKQLLEYALNHAQGEGDMLFRPWGNMVRDLKLACRRAGIDPCGPNDLRRTFATWLRAAGASPDLIAPTMGHVDSRMVERVYGRLDPMQLAALIRGATSCAESVPDNRVSDAPDGQSGREVVQNSPENCAPDPIRTDDLRIRSPRFLLPKPAKPRSNSAARKKVVPGLYQKKLRSGK